MRSDQRLHLADLHSGSNHRKTVRHYPADMVARSATQIGKARVDHEAAQLVQIRVLTRPSHRETASARPATIPSCSNLSSARLDNSPSGQERSFHRPACTAFRLDASTYGTSEH